MAGPLQQLDLFGFPIEPTNPKVKKEKPQKQPEVKQISVANAVVSEVINNVAKIPVAEPVVVYADKAISVRIKKKVEDQQPTTITENKKPNKRGRKSFRDMDTEVDLIDVPDEETLNKKLYYSISEVAGWFRVNTSLLRYWENEFDVLQPRKTRKGDRLFRVEDIKNLQLIYFLLRQRKFSIEGAKNYLKNNKAQADTQSQLVQSLTKFKSFLLELKANLAAH
jgi:DNA-binding transcriptional MerR regulator